MRAGGPLSLPRMADMLAVDTSPVGSITKIDLKATDVTK
jgi:hypothetical protein